MVNRFSMKARKEHCAVKSHAVPMYQVKVRQLMKKRIKRFLLKQKLMELIYATKNLT